MIKLFPKVVPVTKEEFLNLKYGDRILVDPSYFMSLQPIHWGTFDHFHKSGMALYFPDVKKANGRKHSNMYGCTFKNVIKIEKHLTQQET